MNKRSIILISIAVLLAGTYVFCFTNTFDSKQIKIIAMLRADRPRRPGAPPRGPNPLFPGSIPVIFGLDRAYPLTSIKVFSADDLKFSSSAAPLWSLVPENPEKPEKVEGFRYGERVRGMKPADETKPKPEPLQVDAVYRIFVEGGGAKGQTDFKTKAP